MRPPVRIPSPPATSHANRRSLLWSEAAPQDYRHGTTTLLAALNALDGSVISQCRPRHRDQEFIGFLNHLDQQLREIPVEQPRLAWCTLRIPWVFIGPDGGSGSIAS